ncbi:glycosyltransferase family 4 protein [Methylophaga pinxianii]|uniref:glycosyltransferase family 4 protein n=1 Tax=Methylophaga pinxianii TaxID=2881052 RepID=UPI001CF2A259|nr:glycosyltransferase family 4 protein [Methylophaga pinxianii]MCB2425980.1 glycosyltransferase family 4 protein [Methylophaga pinxianii]
MKKLIVVQVLPALSSGGVERGTLEVGQFLSQQGYRSIVISAGGRLVKALTEQGSEHIQWPIGHKSLLTLKLIPKLRRFLLSQQVDIVHARSRLPAWICYLTLKTIPHSKRPHFITTVHGRYSINFYSGIMTKGEKVIVISEMIRDYVMHHYRVNYQRLQLNYRGVDRAEFPYGYQPSVTWLTDWYQQFPETRDKILLCLPARITRWKGQQDFIELIAKLRHRHPNVHGLIVGETKSDKTHYLQELTAHAAKLGVESLITFTGHRNDLRDIMATSHIVFSLSTEPEAFGRIPIEAISLGKPVIAYDHGGVSEQLNIMLPDGLIKVGDKSALVDKCSQWLKAVPEVPTNHPFTLQRMLENTLKIYQSVMVPQL